MSWCAAREWKAYPLFSPPERFPPFRLTPGLYLNNAWENAASAMEMSAVAAKNCALLASQYLQKAFVDDGGLNSGFNAVTGAKSEL